MSEVEVEYGDSPQETAILLLAAAEELGLDAAVVKTTSDGVFLVPEELNDKVFTKAGNVKRTAKKAVGDQE